MLYRTVRNLLYAVLLMPLLLWSAFLFPFITTKVIYFRLLIEAALFFYIILAWRYPAFRPRFNLLTAAVWLYVAVVFVTAIFGVDFATSFMGTVERGEGLITLLHFAVYFTILPAVFRKREQWENYLLAAAGATAAVAFIGFLQAVGLPLVAQSAGGRVQSTIGNASFFSAYLLFGIFLSFYLLKQQPSRGRRIFLWIVTVFELLLLYLSQTRGAILAFLITVLVWAVATSLPLRGISPSLKGRRVILARAIVIFILAAAALIYAGRNSSFVQNQGTLRRLTTISLSNITTQSRLDTWGASARALADRWLIGYGYENYNTAFNKYFPARIYKDSGSQIWFDRAHNIFFDVGLTSGILGILAYLGIFAAAGSALWQQRSAPRLLWQSRGSGPVVGAAALALLLLAYFLQNLFVFDTHATFLMFFLTLAYISSISKYRNIEISLPVPRRTGQIAAIAILVLLLPVAWFVNAEPAIANLLATRGIKAAAAGEDRAARQYYEQALGFGTYMDRELRQRLAESALIMLSHPQLSNQERVELYQFTARELRQSIAAAPRDAKNYLYLMNFLNRAGSASDAPAAAREVLELSEEAVKLSPTRPQNHYETGQAYFLLGQIEPGLQEFQKAIALNPEVKESHFNLLLAGIVSRQEQLTAAQGAAMARAGFEFTLPDYAAIANAYVQVGNKEQTLAAYQRAVRLAPQNVEIHAKLAVSYGDLCRVAEARAETEIVARLEASRTAEAANYLREIEKKCVK